MHTSRFLTIIEWRNAWLHDGTGGALLETHVGRLLDSASASRTDAPSREPINAPFDAPADAPADAPFNAPADAPFKAHGDAVWLHLASPAQIAARIAELHALLLGAGGDSQALLRTHPLLGVPFGVKDNIDVAGMPTTAACPAFAYMATRHAHAVQRLVDAGAVCIGKTNLDQFATGLVGTRSPYGRPASVFDAQRISGGSSSGSAVAVARGDVPFALGTDTAGSGRVPAGFNNIVGLKPTPGRVGTSGAVPACRTLDCISVLALTVDDAAAVLATMEGDDPADAYSCFSAGPARLSGHLSGRLSGHLAGHLSARPSALPSARLPESVPECRPERLRIGVPAAVQLDLQPGETPGYAAAWAQAGRAAQEMGHTLVPLDFAPLHAVADLLYNGPWVAERHAVVQAMLDSNPAALDANVRQVIAQATRFSATDAFRAQYALRAMAQQMAQLWQQVDVLLVPAAPGHPTFAALDADPLGANARLGIYTNFVNLLGWCALAVPGGFCDVPNNLPSDVHESAWNSPPGGMPGSTSGITSDITSGITSGITSNMTSGSTSGATSRSTPQGKRLPFGVTFIAPGGADAALAHFGSRWQAALGLAPGAGTRQWASLAASQTGPALPRPQSQPCLPLAVVGAHLSGMPLNGQLTERGATLLRATTTAPHYRLHALPGTVPPKPGLQRVADGGARIAVEVWSVPLAAVGSLLALVPAPLGLGTLQLDDGSSVHGFICEGHALAGATDITAHGGWRAYMAEQRGLPASVQPPAVQPRV